MQSRVAVESEPVTLPPPSPMAAAVRMLLCAHVRSMPRKRGERFLRELALILESEESVRMLLPTRPKHEREAQAMAQDVGAAWLRQVLPELVRSLPPP